MNPYRCWVDPGAKYVIEGDKPGKCPDAIEIHSFESAFAPEVVRIVIRQQDEPVAMVWQRAIDLMLELKRTLPVNYSALPHGVFYFRYEKILDTAGIEEYMFHRNARLTASWAAWSTTDATERRAGRIALSQMTESTLGPSFERVLAVLEQGVVNRELNRRSILPLLTWAEKQRRATPLDDWIGQEEIGRMLAHRALALLHRETPCVATLQ